ALAAAGFGRCAGTPEAHRRFTQPQRVLLAVDGEDGAVALQRDQAHALMALARSHETWGSAVDDHQGLAAGDARQGHALRLGHGGRAAQHDGEQRLAHAQSLKLLKDSGRSFISFLMMAMAACRSSRLAPVTRTASPWMAPCTLS